MKQRDVIAMLAVASVASALLVVYVRQSGREAFMQIEETQAERDRLNAEWSQLLLEEATQGAHGRVEHAARTRLAMESPPPADIATVILPPEQRRD